VDRDHRAETSSLRALATMREPVVAVAFRTDCDRLDVGRAHTGSVQEQRVGRRQGEPVAIAVPLESLASIGPSYLAPGVGDVITHVVAAVPNRRTENDVNIVDPRAKGGGHGRERGTDNIRDGSPPTGVGNTDGGPAPPGAGIDDQHRLAVGVQGHEHRAYLVRRKRITEPDLRRSGLGALSGVGPGG
jgi:hypothetical protein